MTKNDCKMSLVKQTKYVLDWFGAMVALTSPERFSAIFALIMTMPPITIPFTAIPAATPDITTTTVVTSLAPPGAAAKFPPDDGCCDALKQQTAFVRKCQLWSPEILGISEYQFVILLIEEMIAYCSRFNCWMKCVMNASACRIDFIIENVHTETCWNKIYLKWWYWKKWLHKLKFPVF